MTVHLCPVCWQHVEPTERHNNIAGHMDSLRRGQCPASGQPFHITVTLNLGVTA
jgi:hypothetical protein